jgi:hypothetical protein
MSQFRLTLPSNSSAAYYPNNTMCKFTTRLYSTMELNSEWEAALTEITFPRSWYTIPKGIRGDGGWFLINCKHCLPAKYGDAVSLQDRVIPVGYYESVQDVCTAINAQIVKAHVATQDTAADPLPKLRYNNFSRKVVFEFMKNHRLTFSPSLATVLGVEDDQNPLELKNDETVCKGGRVADITKGINSLFVYCDLLEHVAVGDARAPLLRIVSAVGANGEIITQTFEDPLYVPLRKKNFDSIEIDIRDDFGRSIPFESGKVIVTLHFRRATTPHFL